MTALSRIRCFGLAVIVWFGAVSCESLVYDHEADCSVYYRVRFRYDMNLKFADAVAHEVASVRLYAFDSEGRLVWQAAEQGEALAAADYTMLLDLEPGSYRLMAWCGVDSGDSFRVPEAADACASEELHCRLGCIDGAMTEISDAPVCSDSDLHPLFHGMMDVELPADDNGGEYVYEMSLTKDTNVFRVVLQHLSGEDLRAEDFEFSIEDCNGWLAYDNSLLREVPVVYRPWAVYSGEAGVGSGPAITSVRVVVAEMTVGRLFVRDWTRYSRPRLVIRTAADGGLVASLPVIDYALLVKGQHYRQMDDQEYLDRADQYNMTFFLDQSDRWVSTVVEVLSWQVVVNNSDLSDQAVFRQAR